MNVYFLYPDWISLCLYPLYAENIAMYILRLQTEHSECISVKQNGCDQPDITVCLVLVFISLLASFVRKRKEYTILFKGKLKYNSFENII